MLVLVVCVVVLIVLVVPGQLTSCMFIMSQSEKSPTVVVLVHVVAVGTFIAFAVRAVHGLIVVLFLVPVAIF